MISKNVSYGPNQQEGRQKRTREPQRSVALSNGQQNSGEANCQQAEVVIQADENRKGFRKKINIEHAPYFNKNTRYS